MPQKTIAVTRLSFTLIIWACADVSFQMISFRTIVNILSPEIKSYFCQNDRNEMTAALSFVFMYFM